MMFGWFRKPRQVEHDYCQDNLSAYLDGVISPRDKGRVERHLSECGQCRQALAELRATVALLRQTPALKVPRSFALPLSVGAKRTERRAFQFNPGYLRLAASVATAALILIISGDLLMRSGFLGLQQSPAPASEAYGRGEEPSLVGTTLDSIAEPAAEAAPPLLMAPAPVTTANDDGNAQMLTNQGVTSATSEAVVIVETQAPLVQALPSETFARPAGPPPLPTLAPGSTPVPPPAETEKSTVPTAVPTAEATATPTPTPTATPTPEPTVTPAAAGMIGPGGPVLAVSLVQEAQGQLRAAAPLASDSWARRETILTALRRLEVAFGGLAAVLLSLSVWLRLSHQPA